MIPRKEWKITRIFCQGHRSSFSWAHFLFYVTLDWSLMYDTVLVSYTWYYIIKVHMWFISSAGFHCNSLNYQVVDQECGFSNENQIKSQLRYNRQTHLAQSQQVDWIQSWDPLIVSIFVFNNWGMQAAKMICIETWVVLATLWHHPGILMEVRPTTDHRYNTSLAEIIFCIFWFTHRTNGVTPAKGQFWTLSYHQNTNHMLLYL